MTHDPTATDFESTSRAFAAVARRYCDLLERSPAGRSLSDRLRLAHRLTAELVSIGTTLPIIERSSPTQREARVSLPPRPDFGRYDSYWETVGPSSSEVVEARLSDALRDVYRDVKQGLLAYDAGDIRGATSWWRETYETRWGEHAVDAMRQLHRAAILAEVTPVAASGDGPRVLTNVGGLVDETRVTLGIHGGADLDPDEISDLLRTEPTRSHRAGDRRKSGSPYPRGAWLFMATGLAPEGPEQVAERLLADLPPPDDPVWAELRSRYQLRVGIAVFFAGWHRGYVMQESVLGRLAALGGTIDFGIYSD